MILRPRRDWEIFFRITFGVWLRIIDGPVGDSGHDTASASFGFLHDIFYRCLHPIMSLKDELSMQKGKR
jgi:hypothetical protein